MPGPALEGSPAVASSWCPNCDAAAAGRFCSACGQDLHHDLRRPIRRFLAELVEETLSLDGRLLRTLPALLLRPGKVAAEVVAGRRARYTTPLRLYLGASVALFLAVAGSKETFQFRITRGQGEILRTGERPHSVAQATDRLRADGRVGAFLARHLERLAALPPAEADQRMAAAFDQNAPRALFLLVPVLALLLKLVHPRRFYAEHLVFALHAQSVAFLAMVPSALAGWDWLEKAGMVGAGAWAVLALRRFYQQTWARTAVEFVGIGAVYALLLSAVIAAAALVSLAQM